MQISFAVAAKLISAFVFATRIVQSLYFLNPKFQAYSHLYGCTARFMWDKKNPKTGFLTTRLISDGTNNTYGPPDMNDNTIIKRVYCDGSEKTLQACRRETVPACDRFAGVQCRGIVIVYPCDDMFDSCFCNCISLPLKTLGTFILSLWRVASHLICYKEILSKCDYIPDG